MAVRLHKQHEKVTVSSLIMDGFRSYLLTFGGGKFPWHSMSRNFLGIHNLFRKVINFRLSFYRIFVFFLPRVTPKANCTQLPFLLFYFFFL